MPAPLPSRDSFSAEISLRRSLQEPAISCKALRARVADALTPLP